MILWGGAGFAEGMVLFRRRGEKQILFCIKIRENTQIKWVEIQGFCFIYSTPKYGKTNFYSKSNVLTASTVHFLGKTVNNAPICFIYYHNQVYGGH